MRRPTIWRIEVGFPTRVRTAHLLASALSIKVDDLQREIENLEPRDARAARPSVTARTKVPPSSAIVDAT
jgi:hypothetical protein